MKKSIFALFFFLMILVPAGVAFSQAKVIEEAVQYTVEGVPMKGYLAYDGNQQGKRPGVLVVPEWWGVNDYARKRARMLAELGYTALVVDMYGGGKQASTPQEAGKLSSEVMKNFGVGKARFEGAMHFLEGRPTVDPTRIAAIGYCFGGGVVVNMAGQGIDLKGVVSFHGSLGLVNSPTPGKTKPKVLVLTGGNDSFVPAEQVEAFEREMTGAGADVRVIVYPGAKHSFTNPEADTLGKKFNMPIAYDAAADKSSWDEMKTFLSSILKA
jgi:dienelactone hydrolase